MPELVEVEKPKTAGFVDRGYNYQKRQARMEAEEEEIKKLEAEAKGETPVDEEPTEEVIETQEADTEAKEETISPEERTFKKRYGDLRRHSAKEKKELEEEINRLKNQNTSIVPPKSDEELESWMKEHPDVAGYVQSVAAKQAQAMFDKANIRIEEIDEERADLKRTSAESKIREAHSDFDDLRAADVFHDWADKQPKWVRDALYENSDDPGSVIRVIDLYKMDKGLTKEDKKSKTKDAAKAVTRKESVQVDVEDASNKIRESQVSKMSDAEFADRADEINKAIRSGNFIYDVSGNAR